MSICNNISVTVFLYEEGISMKNISNKFFVSSAIVLAALLLMPACDWFGGESKSETGKVCKTGEAVIKLGGETVLTTDDFKNYLEMYKVAQMQQMPGMDFDAMLAQLPEEQQRMYYNGILEMQLNGALISKCVVDNRWHKAEEYEKNLNMMRDELQKKLEQDEFVKRLSSSSAPSDKDAEKYYKENRATNQYMQQEQFLVKQAGVNGFAVKAKDEAQAKALVASATANARGLKKAAEAMGLKADDLGVVTYQSAKPDRTIAMKIATAQKFPTVDMVKSGDAWYVYEAASKKEAEYAPFAQVKELVKQVMQQDTLVKEYTKKIAELKEQYKVDVNTPFIESLIKKSGASAQQAAPMQAMEAMTAEDVESVEV